MKTPKLLFAVVAALGAMRCAAAVAEVHAPSDFLYAIRLVETGDRYDAPPGRFGEQGAYQFRLSVWRQYTKVPFWRAGTSFADQVATRHYLWIGRQLRLNGVEASDWNIAAAWNSGVGAVVSGRIPRSTRDYATRVVNLVQRYSDLRHALTPVYRIAMDGS